MDSEHSNARTPAIQLQVTQPLLPQLYKGSWSISASLQQVQESRNESGQGVEYMQHLLASNKFISIDIDILLLILFILFRSIWIHSLHMKNKYR